MKEIEQILDQYLTERKRNVDSFLQRHLDNRECLSIQKRFLLQDLIKNPINVFWAFPYLTIKKVLEVSEKLGLERASSLLQKIPKSFKTDYQKEIERLLTTELFDLSGLERKLGTTSGPDKGQLVLKDIRQEISSYCSKQNETADLVASGVIVILSHFIFGDKTLDLFGMGSKLAGSWAKKKAASEFFLGEGVGNVFYGFVPPSPTEKHVFVFTALVLLGFSLLSTIIGVLSFPTQKRFGITKKHLHKLIDGINDRLILTMAKEQKKSAA